MNYRRNMAVGDMAVGDMAVDDMAVGDMAVGITSWPLIVHRHRIQ